MNQDLLTAWAAGLFEGEGSFQIANDVSKGITLSSTDLDVLERLKEGFGGKIYQVKKRKNHWKDAWVWSIQSKESIDFYKKISPYLLSRRYDKGKEWLEKKPIKKDYDKIIPLLKEGKTHKEIGEIIGIERSSVTHYLNRRKIKKSPLHPILS